MDIYTEEEILSQLDEYSLYCHYLGFKPLLRCPYRSPVRAGNGAAEDRKASFSIYERERVGSYANEYMWKDSGSNLTYNIGDIFRLVQLLYGLGNKFDAMTKICRDFGLFGLNADAPIQPLQLITAEKAEASRIRLTRKAFAKKEIDYMQGKYGITVPLLDEYLVSTFSYYWLFDDQTAPGSVMNWEPAFAYQILGRHQLYFPLRNHDQRFRNDWTEACVPGWAQLRRNNVPLIITKAYKDVLCLRALGFEAIAPRGENTPLPDACIKAIQRGFQQRIWTAVFTLFDNDGKHSAHKYPFPERHIPIESQTKDPTDYRERYGEVQSKQLLTSLIYD